jgi:hypothetical protein
MNIKMNKFDRKRLKYNLLILWFLLKFTLKRGKFQWRFTQIIYNLGLAKDRFYEEPWDTYKQLKKAGEEA